MRRCHDDLVSQASLANAAPPKRSRTKRRARISPERRSEVARRRRRGARRGAIRCTPRAGKSSVGARRYSSDVGMDGPRSAQPGPAIHVSHDEVQPAVRVARDFIAGARNRREHGDLQLHGCDPDSVPAGWRSAIAGRAELAGEDDTWRFRHARDERRHVRRPEGGHGSWHFPLPSLRAAPKK